MKKLIFLLGLCVLIFSLAPGVQAAGEDTSFSSKLCVDDDKNIKVLIQATAPVATKVSAIEQEIIYKNCKPTGKEVFDSTNVNLQTKIEKNIDGDYVLNWLGGKVNYALLDQQKKDIYTAWCEPGSGITEISFGEMEVLSDTNTVLSVEKIKTTINSKDILPCNKVCGNGVMEIDEACDDGNKVGGDGCSADCKSTEVCGNGKKDFGEACDDGNIVNGDGCSANCMSDETCGNGKKDPGEVCDDGNAIGGDGCSVNCMSNETCGNGKVDALTSEECDDGNTTSNDGCSSLCKNEALVANVIKKGDADKKVSAPVVDDGTIHYDIPPAVTIQDSNTTEFHGASLIEPTPVQFRNAAGLQETGPKETAMLIVASVAALMWTLFRFRKFSLKD